MEAKKVKEKKVVEKTENKRIDCIYVDNYRGFNNQVIELKDVNFLVGENSTGKTSILNLFTRINSDNFVDEFDLQPLIKIYSSFDDLLFDKTIPSLTIGYKTDKVFMVVKLKERNNKPYPFYFSCIINYSLLSGSLIEDSLIVNLVTLNKKSLKIFFSKYICDTFSLLADFPKLEIELNAQGIENNSIIKTKVGGYWFNKILKEGLNIVLLRKVLIQNADESAKSNYIEKVFKLTSDIVLNTISSGKSHLYNPVRSEPHILYKTNDISFQSNGDHVYSILKADKSKLLTREINKFGEKGKYFSSIEIKNVEELQSALFFLNVNGHQRSFINVGYGISQFFPLIVELILRRIIKMNTPLSIQQPEVHLHPKAQAEFGDLVFELYKNNNGAMLLLETHSDYIIDRFRLRMNKEEGKNEFKSQILFFENKDGLNTITPIKILGNGELEDNIPESYREFFFNESVSMLGL